MSFLAPYMFWGVFAAGIPIALHFFYRSRYRTVPWAAMKFLLTSIEQTSRRLRFQELLLLALRVVLLLVLTLALMRPMSCTSSRGSGRGDAIDAVLVIDNSMSMAARDGSAPTGDPGNDTYRTALKKLASAGGGVTRLDRAKAAALAVIDNLPSHSTVQVIASSDRATLLGPRVPTHLDQARQLIQDIEITDLATDFLPGISEAGAALQRGHAPNKELYLFSDMQRLGWEQKSAALADKLKEVGASATIHLVHCGTRLLTNVSIAGITPQSSLRTGERADFAVLVRNSGKEMVSNLTVSLEVDGRTEERDSRPLEKLKPGETQAVILTGLLQHPGRRTITARVHTDDLEADNQFDQVIHVRDQVGILLVDGAPNERDPKRAASFYLQHALNPRPADLATPLPVYVVTADQATPRHLANKDLCILVNVALQPAGKDEVHSLAPEFIKALAGFVQDGHGLMIFAGNHADPEAYNRLLFEQTRLLPMRITGVANAPDDKPLTLDRQSADAHPFLKFRQDEGYTSINQVEVRRMLALDPAPSADPLEEVRVLLRYSNGQPALVGKKKAGAGDVLLFTTSVNDPRWTDWFISLPFVPMVQVALNYLLEGQPLVYNRVAGEPLRWQPPRSGAASAYDLKRPDGTRVRLGYPESTEGRPVLTAPDTPRAGVYRLVRNDGAAVTEEAGQPGRKDDPAPEGVPFAVVPDLRETEDLESLKPAQLDERLGIRLVHLTAGDDGADFSGAERLKREWTGWLLAALLVLVLCESVLAWLCGRAW